MDSREDEDRPSSPILMLQHLSEEACRVAGEALSSVYPGHSNIANTSPLGWGPGPGPGHRRAQSEVLSGHNRSNSFHRLKTQVQRAWKWGSNSRDEGRRSNFNPEVLANQKRQWYQLHSKVLDHTNYKEPTSLFEHFVVAGLQPDANLETVEAAFAKRKEWEMEMSRSELVDFNLLRQRGPSFPSLEPQILFKYPPGKKIAMRWKDLAAFCFPAGVKAQLLERTPSLSDLNELIYGQEHLGRDDLSFIFSLKGSDNATLYGVCLHVLEIVQRPPGILGGASPLSHSSGGFNRFLVSAPRCYCVLTRVPFFELHYEMLNSIIAQQRLNRITEFVTEMSLYDYVPSTNDQMHQNVESPEREPLNGWMNSAIPVDSAVAMTAAAAGIIPDVIVPQSSLRIWEPTSPESITASESSEISQAREIDKDGRKNLQYFDDNASEASETRSDTLERLYGSYEGHSSPDIRAPFSSRFRTLEHLESSEFLFSPARSMTSEDDDDELFANFDKDHRDDLIMEWAKENKNDLLQIICGYHSLPLPPRGGKLVFQPLEHLQSIEYRRPPVPSLGFHQKYSASLAPSEVNFKLAAFEEALALSLWTTATICRALSLENVLSLLTGVLLEKQVVVVCPNLGLLSATVLSIIPMILPFQWQSLILPVLPGRMAEFLDAPVPFIVGLLNKPNELKMKTSNLVHVDVLKDQVKTCSLPTLPRQKELANALAPFHAKLSRETSMAKKHPVHKCSETQAYAADKFLKVTRGYLESLCSDLRLHTITSVQSNNDRVSLLLKDSFIDSFSSRDQPFIKHFVDTQMFSVLSDSRLLRFENGQL
ncbi:hypothetical protein CsatB_025019 [Cannabis sativa]